VSYDRLVSSTPSGCFMADVNLSIGQLLYFRSCSLKVRIAQVTSDLFFRETHIVAKFIDAYELMVAEFSKMLSNLQKQFTRCAVALVGNGLDVGRVNNETWFLHRSKYLARNY
jgi:hypothetical protein